MSLETPWNSFSSGGAQNKRNSKNYSWHNENQSLSTLKYPACATLCRSVLSPAAWLSVQGFCLVDSTLNVGKISGRTNATRFWDAQKNALDQTGRPHLQTVMQLVAHEERSAFMCWLGNSWSWEQWKKRKKAELTCTTTLSAQPCSNLPRFISELAGYTSESCKLH